MIGYYVHHQGSGHRQRALAVQRAGELELVALSTAPRPAGWSGDWCLLPDDDTGPGTDPTAGGRLHYVPQGATGLRARMAALSSWFEAARPDALVVDVSVEVALLARLHGIPVVVVAQPGRRHDPAHRLAYDIASLIIAPWPASVGGLWGATPDDLTKTHFVGAVSRFAPTPPGAERTTRPGAVRRVVVLNGTGGAGATPHEVCAARSATPDWEWVHLDAAHGTWVADPRPLLESASVVVSHAGQNAIAEIAAVGRPALMLPQERPFAEQQVMAAALRRNGYPIEVRHGWPAASEWPRLLSEVADLDATAWTGWNDGGGASRMAELLQGMTTSGRLAPEGVLACGS